VAAEGTFTIYDLHSADVPRSARELPRLVLAALRIVWSELFTVQAAAYR
jgi:hypothetical protein